jgi:YD repeat-containing protein
MTRARRDSAPEVLVSYDHDPLGRLVSMSDALGRTSTMGSDDAGRLVSVARPGGSCASTPGVECVRYGYDDAGRMTLVDYSDPSTPDVSYTYRPSGHRASMTDGTGTTSWSYDSLGRVVSVTDGWGATLGYGYDRRSLITEIVYPNTLGVAQEWDEAGRLVSITDWDDRVFAYSYDPGGALEELVWPGGVNTTSYSYDTLGQLTGIEQRRD